MHFVTILENKNSGVAIIELSKQKAVTPNSISKSSCHLCVSRERFFHIYNIQKI